MRLYYLLLKITFLYALDPWMHSVHLYGSSYRNPAYMQETLYDSVKRRVVLQDGRSVTCEIPLDPTFGFTKDSIQQRTKPVMNTIVYEEITSSQALQILYPLRDQCAYQETTDFIWEFCFKKYVRQFDNEQTVKNLQKKQYEEFFIGYSNNYNKENNQTIGIYMPQWANLPVVLMDVPIEMSSYLERLNSYFLMNEKNNRSSELPEPIYFDIPKGSEDRQLHGVYLKLNRVLNQKIYQLKLRLKLHQFRDVEILFYSEPNPSVYAREYGLKGNFSAMDPRFANRTLLDKTYWIIVDFEGEDVTVGYGYNIMLANVLLKHQLRRDNHEEHQRARVEFDLDSTGLRVSKLMAMNLSDYQARRLPWSTVGPVFDPLNFSGYSILESTYEMSEVHYQFTEKYTSGSFCKAAGNPRQIDIRLTCSKRSFLEIKHVTEPKICIYKMEVGTSLLCDPQKLVKHQQSRSSQNGQRMVCTLNAQ